MTDSINDLACYRASVEELADARDELAMAKELGGRCDVLATDRIVAVSERRVRDDAVTLGIRTEYIYPPIPVRQFDWSAVSDDYEPNMPIGRGATEAQAIADLMMQVEGE